MKKARKVVLYMLLGFAVAAMLWMGNAFLGNPVSHMLASRTARQFLAEQFPGSDYEIVKVNYSFKTGDYYAHVESPSSRDSYFSICLDMLGKLKYHSFDSVEDGWNTAQRLDQEYRKLTDTVLKAPSLPYDNQSIYSIMYGSLEITSREYWEDPNITDIPVYALIQEDLILDHDYDIKALGAQAGHLILYVNSETLTYEEAARIMLDFKDRFDKAEIPFYAMDFTLCPPRKENGTAEEGAIHIRDFLYKDIYPENLSDRLHQAHKATQAYYDSLDAK